MTKKLLLHWFFQISKWTPFKIWKGFFKTETWTILILCIFGFFREMKPSDPYATEYLTGPPWNNTPEFLNKEIIPLSTYSFLILLILVFLITDILRYKPIIISSAMCGTGAIAILIWSFSDIGLKLSQVLHGAYASSEVAYFTYMYAKVDRNKYERVTGFARAAILLGRFSAAVVGQLLVTYNLMSFRDIYCISFGCQITSLIFAILLPSVGTSLYFYVDEKDKGDNVKKAVQNNNNLANTHILTHTQEAVEKAVAKPIESTKTGFSISYALNLMKNHLGAAYTDHVVLCWSIWWALATAGYLLASIYCQILWKTIVPVSIYNGGVDAAQTLCSAIGAYSAGFVNSDRTRKRGFLILSICSIVEGCILIWSGLTSNIWEAYTSYVLFACIYNFVLTLANAIVAKRLPEECFALIFGINTFLALIIQTIMTLIFISDHGFALNPSEQYKAFGYYFVAIAVTYSVKGFVSYVKSRRNKTYTVNC